MVGLVVFGGAQGERTGPVPVHPSRTQTLRWGSRFLCTVLRVSGHLEIGYGTSKFSF